MMNDRFDAQLREHLLGTADTSPADGQLAGVIQAVGGTAQRHPVVARLTWFPGRVGPVPSRALRVALVAAVIAGMVFAAAFFIGNPGRSTVFEGTWTSTDPGDQSTQSLIIGQGKAPTVRFVDYHASGAACRDDAVKVFTADGSGAVAENHLVVTWPKGGGCGLMTVPMPAGSGTYTYTESSDTIADGDGLTWHRDDGAAPPTRGPQTPESTVEVTPGPVPSDCVDLSSGGLYSARVGSLFVSMDVPFGTTSTWQGATGGGFKLTGSCSFDTPIQIEAGVVDTVYSDACDPASSAMPVTSYAMAVEQFETQHGHVITRMDGATEQGWPASLFKVDFATSSCGGATPLALWNGQTITEATAEAFLVDVDGVTLGIVLRLIDNAADPLLTPAMIQEAESIVASVQIVPGLTPEATNPPVQAACIEFDSAATYQNQVGTLPLSLTVPASPTEAWHGDRDAFALERATCAEGSGPIRIEADLVGHVYADACHWQTTDVEVPTAFDAVQALASQAGHETVAPIDTHVGPFRATRIDVTVPPGYDASSCDDAQQELLGVRLFNEQFVAVGETAQVYVAEVDGTTLVITVTYDATNLTPADLAEIDQIIASARVDM